MKGIFAAFAFVGVTFAAVAAPIPNGPCNAIAESSAPEPDINTLDAFRTFVNYTVLAWEAPRKIDGFQASVVSASCSLQSSKYMLYTKLSAYDVEACAKVCNSYPGCNAFNIYIQRTPVVTPGPRCPNPKAVSTSVCALYSESVSYTDCTNYGQYIGPEDVKGNAFRVAIQASNIYLRIPVMESDKVATTTSSDVINKQGVQTQVQSLQETSSAEKVNAIVDEATSLKTTPASTYIAIVSSTSVVTLPTDIPTAVALGGLSDESVNTVARKATSLKPIPISILPAVLSLVSMRPRPTLTVLAPAAKSTAITTLTAVVPAASVKSPPTATITGVNPDAPSASATTLTVVIGEPPSVQPVHTIILQTGNPQTTSKAILASIISEAPYVKPSAPTTTVTAVVVGTPSAEKFKTSLSKFAVVRPTPHTHPSKISASPSLTPDTSFLLNKPLLVPAFTRTSLPHADPSVLKAFAPFFRAFTGTASTATPDSLSAAISSPEKETNPLPAPTATRTSVPPADPSVLKALSSFFEAVTATAPAATPTSLFNSSVSAVLSSLKKEAKSSSAPIATPTGVVVADPAFKAAPSTLLAESKLSSPPPTNGSWVMFLGKPYEKPVASPGATLKSPSLVPTMD